MLDRRLLQREPEKIATALKNRKSSISMDDFSVLDVKRRAILSEVEGLKNDRNTTSSDVAKTKREGGDPTLLINKMGAVNARIKSLDEELAIIDEQLDTWLLNIPNIPDVSVPIGNDENDNPILHTWGEPRQFSFAPKEHWELGEALGGLDFDRGAKITGSRFLVYWRWAAKLERALISFFLDIHTAEHGYIEIAPPFMVNQAAMTGTGNLPKFAEDLFKLENWDYYLIPTAEVPLTNLYSGEILPESSLPMGFTAYSPCFRSEAGSYGKDTKGLIRLHQFSKVEMVRYAHPEQSFHELERMRAHAEILLQRLEIPYRVITLCTGDMGFASAKTYDIEVWLPGQNKYREISSCSNCLDFQARRMNLRFKPTNGGKSEFIHTLNGSGLAVGRTIVAIIENGQQEDGSFTIPQALVPYMNGVERISPSEEPSL